MEGITSQVATVDYLQLLTIQLQNQDPIDPVDQEGLINDLTQFSQLEGLENLNTSFSQMLKLQEINQGLGLVGKEVSYQDIATGEVKTGKATEMWSTADSLNVIVEGQTVSIESIIGVRDPQADETTDSGRED